MGLRHPSGGRLPLIIGALSLAGAVGCGLKKSSPPKIQSPGYETQTLSHITSPSFSLSDHVLTVTTRVTAQPDRHPDVHLGRFPRGRGDPGREPLISCRVASISAVRRDWPRS